MLAAVAFNAIVASVGLDRLIVQMPAWRQVGVQALGNLQPTRGSPKLYPIAAFGGAALSLAAVVKVRRDRTASRAARLAVYTTATFDTLGLLVTTQAAPYMLSLHTIGDDPPALQHAFAGFDRWGGIRAAVQILAFAANLWSLVGVTAPRRLP
jgi:hypothetical protein